MMVETKLPALPRIPKLPVPRKVRGLPGEHFWLHRLCGYREAGELDVAKLQPHNPVVRNHGCRLCPYYNSSRCLEGMRSPYVFGRGICDYRLNEVLDFFELSGSISGKEAKRLEVVEKIRNHIVLLESNFTDYREERLKRVAAGDILVYDAGVGAGEGVADSEKAGGYRNAYPDELVAFDSYEMSILNQIERLSGYYAKFIGDSIDSDIKKDEVKHGVKNVLNVEEINLFMRQGSIEGGGG